MENYKQTAPTNSEELQKSKLTVIQTTLATELIENDNLADGIINPAFTVLPMANEAFVENRSHVDGLNNLSSTEVAKSTNSNAPTEELTESRNYEYDICKENTANKYTNTVVYGVDERPPLIQSILLGFQVRVKHYVKDTNCLKKDM